MEGALLRGFRRGEEHFGADPLYDVVVDPAAKLGGGARGVTHRAGRVRRELPDRRNGAICAVLEGAVAGQGEVDFVRVEVEHEGRQHFSPVLRSRRSAENIGKIDPEHFHHPHARLRTRDGGERFDVRVVELGRDDDELVEPLVFPADEEIVQGAV